MTRGLAPLCVALLLVLAACNQTPTNQPTAKTHDSPAPLAQADQPADASAEPKPVDKAGIDKLKKAYDLAKSQADKARGDKGKKADYEKATMQLADAYMYTQDVDRSVKYKKALEFYREAYKADPSNDEAKSNIDLIESIYKSLGKPVPK